MEKVAEQEQTKSITEIGDQVAAGVGIVGTGLAVVSMVTPLAPIAAVGTMCTAVGIWTLGRGTGVLVDRYRNGESVDPRTDRNAFYTWLSVAGAACSLGSTAGVDKVVSMAEKGEKVGRATRALTTVANYGNFSIQAIYTAATGANIADKHKNGEKISTWEWLQLSTGALFFARQAKNLKTGNQIVREVQNESFHDYRNLDITKRQDKRFRYMNNKDFKAAPAEDRMGGETTMRKIYNFWTTGKYGL